MPQVVKRLLALALRGVRPLTARAGMPASLKTRAMYSACATLTQNPSARIAPRSITLSRSCFSTTNARASLPVKTFDSCCLVVACPRDHADAAQIGAICHSEVVKRAQEVGAQGIPEPQLSGSTTSEELADVDAVGSFGRGGQARAALRGARWSRICRYVRASAWWNSSITTMSKASAGMLLNAVRRQRLNAGEHMSPPLGSRPSDVKLAEAWVSEDLSIGPQGLLENFLAMGDKEQRR